MDSKIVKQYRMMRETERWIEILLGGNVVEDIIDSYLCQNDIEEFKNLFWEWGLSIDFGEETVTVDFESGDDDHNRTYSIEGLLDEHDKIEKWAETKREELTEHLASVCNDWRMEIGERVTGLVHA